MKEELLKHFLTHQAFTGSTLHALPVTSGTMKPSKPDRNSSKEQIEQYNRDLGVYNREEKSARARKTGFHPVDDPAEVERRYLIHQAEWLPKKQESDRLKREAFLRAQAEYDEKMGGGRSTFRKINNALIDIADAGVQAPFMPAVVKDFYETFRPEKTGGSLESPVKKKKVIIGCSCGCNYCENKK